MKKQIALIGLGKQNTKDHLVAAQKNQDCEIVGLCDHDYELAQRWGERLGVPAYATVSELVANVKLDAAIVAVPHFAYLPIITLLAEKGIHILKEKPLATSYDEAREIAALAQKSDINLTIAVQRKHNKIYQAFLEYMQNIGEIFSIHGHYTLNIEKLDDDWRRSRKLAGGGAVIDMGYHLIDLIVWYFGVPERISADLGYHNREDQDYDVEDTAKIQFSYSRGQRRILGSLLLSRIYPEKDEALSVYGTKGTIIIYKDRIELRSLDKKLLESMYMKANGEDVSAQMNMFIKSLDDKSEGNYKEHLNNMVFIDAVYTSDSEGRTIKPYEDERYKSVSLQKEDKVIV